MTESAQREEIRMHFYAIYANAVEAADVQTEMHPAHRNLLLRFAESGLAGMRMSDADANAWDLEALRNRITEVRNTIA